MAITNPSDFRDEIFSASTVVGVVSSATDRAVPTTAPFAEWRGIHMFPMLVAVVAGLLGMAFTIKLLIGPKRQEASGASRSRSPLR